MAFAQLRGHDVPVPGDPDRLTQLGALVERARERRGISKREAARVAGISEGRWRQVVTGVQKAGEVDIPVNPRRNTVIAMARAVGVDQNEALQAAGFPAMADAGASETTSAVPMDPDVVRVLAKLADPDTSPATRAWIKQMLRDLAEMPSPVLASEPEEQRPRRRRAL